MIYYFARADNLAPMDTYLGGWAGWLGRRMTVVTYEEMPRADALPDATFIFTDIERLPLEMTERAVALWDALSARGGRVRLLNHPTRALRRPELLRTLHERGINHFNVHRLNEPRGKVRYPVFVRSTTEHKGAYTPLLNDAAELERAIVDLKAGGHAEENLLIVEFIETGRDGFYRKWSLTRVGDQYLAHHVMSKAEWQVKHPNQREALMVLEEDAAYRRANPHADQLREIFRLANIDYGRVDYGMHDGCIQVWEINSNPTLLYPRRRYKRKNMALRLWFARRLNRAFLAIDDRSPECRTLFGRLARCVDRWR